MGWTGDAQVFARTATYNMNVDPFYTRWLYSVRDNQGDDGSYANYIPVVGFPPHGAEDGGGAMGWMEAGMIVPWQMYQQYGDVRILEQHYASMVAYMDYLERRARTLCTALRWFRRLAGYRADEFHVDEHRLFRLRRFDYGAGSETFREGCGPKAFPYFLREREEVL